MTVFKHFPVSPELYGDDIQPIVAQTIERFGLDEWRACVLTNELHGHLGIYAIMGVKMGIAAVEQLGVSIGDISIHSYAGVNPPVSCMNDGLQVSTGATFGHGLITSFPTAEPKAMADFTANGRTIRIRFKKEIEAMIGREIEAAVKNFGHTPPYWKHIRQLAIKYWAELDRKEIVEITETK